VTRGFGHQLTFLEYTVLAPKKKKKIDDEEDVKRYDWAIVLGGTKYVTHRFTLQHTHPPLTEPQQ
jgi:hypothetical protein